MISSSPTPIFIRPREDVLDVHRRLPASNARHVRHVHQASFDAMNLGRTIRPSSRRSAMSSGSQDTSTDTTTLLQKCLWILLLHGLVPAVTDVTMMRHALKGLKVFQVQRTITSSCMYIPNTAIPLVATDSSCSLEMRWKEESLGAGLPLRAVRSFCWV